MPGMICLLREAGWEEEAHPRDEKGKFAPGKGNDEKPGDKKPTRRMGHYTEVLPDGMIMVKDVEIKPRHEFISPAKSKAEEILGPKSVEYTRKVQEHLNDKSTGIYVRVPGDVLPQVVNDGRLKSQYESGTSSGKFSPTVRSHVESKLFSYPENFAESVRPIYGYVESDDVDHSDAEISLQQYGEVLLRLKDDVKARATVTGGDSLNASTREYIAPTPMSKFGPEAVFSGILNNYREGARGLGISGASYNESFIEAQIHGGVLLSDIAEVKIPKHSRALYVPAQDTLRQRGVKVSYYG